MHLYRTIKRERERETELLFLLILFIFSIADKICRFAVLFLLDIYLLSLLLQYFMYVCMERDYKYSEYSVVELYMQHNYS